MTALIIILAVIVFVVLIALIRVGVSVVYDAGGVEVSAHVAFVRVRIYPQKKKKIGKKIKKKDEEKPKSGGSIKKLKELLNSGTAESLRRLKRRLTISELTIYYCAAGGDASKVAFSFGAASAAFGIVLPFLENNFKIKKRDLRAMTDFYAPEQSIFVHLKMTLAVWEIIYIASSLLGGLLKASMGKSKKRKVDNDNGKTSDWRSDGDNNGENQRDG